MTTLTFQLARALGRQFAPGTEIVVTQLDHRANVDPWADMANMWNFELRTVPFRPSDGTLDWEMFESVVGERTGLIAIGGASNALGTVNDVAAGRRPREECRAACCSSMPSIPCRIFRRMSRHSAATRWPAPRTSSTDRMRGCCGFGAPCSSPFTCRNSFPRAIEAPERLETGTLSHEAIAGTDAAVDFLSELDDGPGDRRSRLSRIMDGTPRPRRYARPADCGTAWPRSKEYGHSVPHREPRNALPTVSFIVDDMSSSEVSHRLAERVRRSSVRSGTSTPPDVAVRLGVENVKAWSVPAAPATPRGRDRPPDRAV